MTKVRDYGTCAEVDGPAVFDLCVCVCVFVCLCVCVFLFYFDEGVKHTVHDVLYVHQVAHGIRPVRVCEHLVCVIRVFVFGRV